MTRRGKGGKKKKNGQILLRVSEGRKREEGEK